MAKSKASEQASATVNAPVRIVKVKLDNLILDPAAQPRVAMDSELIEEYAESMREGSSFPAVVAFGSTRSALVADGFSRVTAARAAGLKTIDVDLRRGGISEAVWYSVGANAEHGKRRTNDDKRRAVRVALAARAELSDGAIAAACRVSDRFVGTIRAQTSTPNDSEITTRVGADGRTRDVSNIGKANRRKNGATTDDNPFSGNAAPGPVTAPASPNVPSGDGALQESEEDARARLGVPRRASDPTITDDYVPEGGFVCGDCGEPVDETDPHDHSQDCPAVNPAEAAAREADEAALPGAVGIAPGSISPSVREKLSDVQASASSAAASVYSFLTTFARLMENHPDLDMSAAAAVSENPLRDADRHTSALRRYLSFVEGLQARAALAPAPTEDAPAAEPETATASAE